MELNVIAMSESSNDEEPSNNGEVTTPTSPGRNSIQDVLEKQTEEKYPLENFDTSVELGEFDPEITAKLTEGFMTSFVPEGETVKLTLQELLQNQKVLIETVQHEKSKFTECKAFNDLTDVMFEARQYYNKLVTVKKDMAALHDKSIKLKKRALRLQQQKQKEMLQMEQKRERELEKERALMARPVKRTSSDIKERGGVI